MACLKSLWVSCNLKREWLRKKVADVTKTMASVTPDKKAVMFKIVAHDMAALHAFLDGTNPVSKPIFDEVMEGYEIFELSKV